MQDFHIDNLETQIGIVRVAGFWSPINSKLTLQDIALLEVDSWTDISFWLTEQHYEADVAIVYAATADYLLTI